MAFSGSHFENNTSLAGGMSFVETNEVLTLLDVTATSHEATNGGFVGTRGDVYVDGLVSDQHVATSTGGAFHVESSATLSLCNATLTGGSAETTGGAIHARGPVTIGTGCIGGADPGPVTIAHHTASNGGAIDARTAATLSVTSTTFTDHEARSDGGTIYLDANDAVLTDVRIERSSAEARGGGIFVNNPVGFQLTNATIEDASADTFGGCVGLLASAPGEAKLADVTLTGCVSVDAGGGLYTNGALEVDGLTIADSVAGLDGGGLHLTSTAERTLDHLTVTNSYALLDGGAVSVQSTGSGLTTLTDFVAQDCDALNGGALAVRDADVVVDGFRLERGLASDGAAVIMSGDSSSLTLRRGLVCGNAGGRGAISTVSNRPELEMDQVALVGNTGSRGGAIELQDTTEGTLQHLHFVGNEATFGAALFAESTVQATVSEVVVVDNQASAATSGAIDGLVPTGAWYEGNTPVGNPADPSPDTPAGMLHDGACSWEALRTVDRQEAHGVWGPVSTDPTTWPDGTDPLRDDDSDGVPWMHDCDDLDPGRSYLTTEVCDGLDNDCDGLIDDEDPGLDLASATVWFPDQDEDGRGDENLGVQACEAPEGHIAAAGDCDDTDSSLPLQIYRDDDNDGVGAGPAIDDTCDTPAPPGFSFQASDCDDTDPTVGPPSQTFLDADQDGHGAQVELGMYCPGESDNARAPDDCDDTRSDVSPSGTEACDGVDNDCDGEVDEDVQIEVWMDNDGDGVGSGDPTLTCNANAGALIGGDCNDADPDRTFDCDDATATYTPPGGDDDDDTPATGDGPRATAVAADSGCACRAAAPAPTLPWLRRRR